MKEKKEVKYPIKYAVMPVKENDCSYGKLGQECRVVANIVSKCYVVSEKKLYLGDGNYKTLYEVVFPYKKVCTEIEVHSEHSIPEFNIYSECTNSICVNQLFDSYSDTLTVVNKLNEDILYQEIGCLPYNDEFESNVGKLKMKHQKTLDKCKKFENCLKKRTIDMEITKTNSSALEDVIEKIVENPSEFYIKVASVLSYEEREYLKQLIENRSCTNCNNVSCNVEYHEKVGLDESLKPQGNNCLGWTNPELIGRKKVLMRTINI